MRSALRMASTPHRGYEPLTTRTASKPGYRRKTWLLRGVGLCVLLALFLATSLTLGRKDNLRKMLLWIHEHTVAGLVIFGLLYVWFTVMFLPPALLAACAGALYGLLKAIPVVWVCAVIGETVSFLLGRFLLRKWVAELTSDWPMWVALNAALSEDGWKLVALLRVSPAMPFSVINYALGSSSLPFSHYFWPSVFGIIPSLIIYIWLGSLAADVTEAVAGGGSMAAPPAAKITIIVVCAVSALIVIVLSAVYTKRAIDKRLASVDVREEVQVEEQHLLLGRSSTSQDEEAGGGYDSQLASPAAAAAHGSQQQQWPRHHPAGVVVCVESPVLVVGGGSKGGDAGGPTHHTQQQQQPEEQQQQHVQPLNAAAAIAPTNSSSWAARAAQKLGWGVSSSKKLKVKAEDEAELDGLEDHTFVSGVLEGVSGSHNNGGGSGSSGHSSSTRHIESGAGQSSANSGDSAAAAAAAAVVVGNRVSVAQRSPRRN